MPELVGADHEDRVLKTLATRRLDGARIQVQANVVGGEGDPRQRQPVLGGRVDLAMTGLLVSEENENRSLAASATATCPMRRVERAAVRLLPLGGFLPQLDVVAGPAPAALRIASSSSSAGGVR